MPLTRCRTQKVFLGVAATLLSVLFCHASVASPSLAAAQRPVDFGRGSWCWFQDPRAIYSSGRTFAGWIDEAGYVVIASIGQRGSTRTRIARLGNRAYHDDHGAPGLLVEPDGRITAFYSAHSGPFMYARTTISPGDITTWGPQVVTPADPTGATDFTYPNPVYLSAEQSTYLFWRGSVQPIFAVRDRRGEWSQAHMLIDEPEGVPYVKVDSNGSNAIYFAFTDGHPRNRVTSIYFAAYREGALRHASGAVIATLSSAPIRPAQADRVYDASRHHNIRAWVDDVAATQSGSPVILYTTMPYSARWRQYNYAWWDGHKWRTHVLGSGGATITTVQSERFYSGGMYLDHNDPRVLYASVGSFGHHRLERLSTSDGGRSWQRRWITSGQADNIRPVVPRGLPPGKEEVLWMHGWYGRWQGPATSIVGVERTLPATRMQSRHRSRVKR
jgi:hypothetical protein